MSYYIFRLNFLIDYICKQNVDNLTAEILVKFKFNKWRLLRINRISNDIKF